MPWLSTCHVGGLTLFVDPNTLEVITKLEYMSTQDFLGQELVHPQRIRHRWRPGKDITASKSPWLDDLPIQVILLLSILFIILPYLLHEDIILIREFNAYTTRQTLYL